MKIAITGASGFLGSTISHFLLELGHEIILHENKNPVNENLFKNATKVVKGSLSDDRVIDDFLSTADALIHSAAYIPKDISNYKDREACVTNNVFLTQDLAKYCANRGGLHLVYLSTANFYANNESGTPVDENGELDLNIGGCLQYFLSKYAAEISINSILKKDSFAILRISSPFGMGEPIAKLVPTLLRNLISAEPVSIFGTGDENINIVSNRDVAGAVEKVLQKRACGVFNINGHSITIKELLYQCESVAGNDFKNIKTLNNNVVSFAKVCNKKAFESLDWSPTKLKDSIMLYYNQLKN